MSYVVWDRFFSSVYPLAIILSISYHITQNIIGTLVAHFWLEATDGGLGKLVAGPNRSDNTVSSEIPAK